MTTPKGGVVLVDGPCAGRYSVTRAPVLLRAVVNRATGALDLLDQLYDQPGSREAIHVYQLDTTAEHFDPHTWTRTHLMIICPPRGATATYRHRPDVDGELLRTTAAWRAWARAQTLPIPTLDGATLEPHEARP